MAEKLTAQDAIASGDISSDDLLYMVEDPDGTPLSKKVTVGTFMDSAAVRELVLDYLGDTVFQDGGGVTALHSDVGNTITLGTDGILQDLDTLGASAADGEFLVATGAGTLAWESGATARTSLGVGTGDSPTFTGLSLSADLVTTSTIDGVDIAAHKTAYDAHAADVANPHSVTQTQVGLSLVENTALSTWAGTANVTTLGTIGTGTWQGTAVQGAYTDIDVSELTDVTITTIGTGELLTWNGTAFINETLAEAGISATGHTHTESDITDLGTTVAMVADNLSVFSATTSAQLAGVISNETGSGALVFATSPTLVTPALGTPASGVLTNTTGYAASDLTASQVTDFSTAADARIALAVLDDLADVTETTITTGDVLRWNGTLWVNYADSAYATAGGLSTHIADVANPHAVTQTQVGLSLVENTALSTWAGTANVTTVGAGAVTAHQAALSLTASQTTDFSAASDARIALAVLDDLADVTETTITTGDLLRWNGTLWVNYADSAYGTSAAVALNTTHRTSDGSDHTFIDQSVVSGSTPTFGGANITGVATVLEAAVTAHQAALSLTASQTSDFSTAADARIALAVLDDLADVTETTITTGDLLRWNGTLWVNYADSAYATAGGLSTHIADTANPHGVTKAQVGLTNVEDTALSTWAGTANITTVGAGAVTAHVAAIDHDALLNFDAAEHYAQSAITATGIIASGTWQGTAVADAYVAGAAGWDTAVTHITSTGADHTWIDQDVTSGSSPTFDGTNITGLPTVGSADTIASSAKKGSVGTITAGTVVYLTGWNVGGGYIEVEEADASVASTMPAIGVASTTITNSTAGTVVFKGVVTGLDTSGYSVNDALYVSETTGLLTGTKPTGTALIQKIALVARSNITQGVIRVVGAGRSNDVPNIASTNFWVGNGSAVATAVAMSADATMDNTGAVTLAATNTNLTTLANVTTVGALNSGSITSGFGAIDIGASTFDTTGAVTMGHQSLVTGSQANTVEFKVQNTHATTGTYDYGVIVHAGLTGFGITGWPEAMIVEGAARGGLVLSAVDAASGGILMQTGASRTTRLTIDTSGDITTTGNYAMGAGTITTTGTAALGQTTITGAANALTVNLPSTTSGIVAKFQSPSYDSIDVYVGASEAYIGVTSTTPFRLKSNGTTVAELAAGALTVTGTGAFSSTVGVLSGGTSTAMGILVSGTGLATAAQYGAVIDPIFSSAATATGRAIYARVQTAAAAFTMGNGYGINIASPSVGAGSGITNAYGLKIEDQAAGASTNHAIYTGTGLVHFGDNVDVTRTDNAHTTLTIESQYANRDPQLYLVAPSETFIFYNDESAGNPLKISTASGTKIWQFNQTGSTTFPGAFTTTGTATSTLGVRSTGAFAAHVADCVAMDFSAGNARIWAVGADAATAGSMQILVSSTDGSPAFTTTYDATGLWTMPAGLTVTGTGSFTSYLHTDSYITSGYHYATYTGEQLRLRYDVPNYTAFTVDSGGDLLIDPSGGGITLDGTVTTNNNLTVTGTVTTTGGTTGGFYFGENGNIQQDASYNWLFSTNGVANVMSIASATGNVGIGTTSPDETLNVVSTHTTNHMCLMESSTLTSGHGLYVYNNTSVHTGNVARIYQDSASATGAALYVHTDGSGGAAAFMGGSVGIGTTSPNAELDVAASATPQIHITNTTQGTSETAGVTFSHKSGNWGQSADTYLYSNQLNSTTGAMEFIIKVFDGVGGYNEVLTIDGNSENTTFSGNVGIGQTTPVAALHLGSTAGTAASGINFGGDTNLYRPSANVLKTDDVFHFASDIYVNSVLHYSGGGTPISIGSASELRVYSGGLVAINDTANANMTVGLCIQQGANDDEAFALKSSDVAHGMTTITETDTYYKIQKLDANNGGALLDGLSEGTYAYNIRAGVTTDSATRTTGGVAPIILQSSLKSGATFGACAADKNLLVIRNHGTTRFIFDSDGDSHQDVGTAWTNFDHEQDAMVVRSVGITMGADSIIKSRFDDWSRDHKADLIRTGLIPELTAEQEANGERPLMNTTQLARLHNGAIWQNYEAIMDTRSEVEQLRDEVAEYKLLTASLQKQLGQA